MGIEQGMEVHNFATDGIHVRKHSTVLGGPSIMALQLIDTGLPTCSFQENNEHNEDRE